MAGTGGGKSGKGGTGGNASPAALYDDDELQKRRGRNFRTWADARRQKKPNQTSREGATMAYPNSPAPPSRH